MRKVMVLLTVSWLVGLVGCTTPSGLTDGDLFAINACGFGAIGDGKKDNTAAIQTALDTAAKAGGGIVNLPVGSYRVAGNLNVPDNVTLQGVWTSPPNWQKFEFKGTTLLVEQGHGQEQAPAFITMGTSSTIKGLTIFYPKQSMSDPQPYPWCVAVRDNWGPDRDADGNEIWKNLAVTDVAIIDVMMVNPFKAVNLDRGARHLIRNLYGTPIRTGIFVDQCLDVGRIENVHFWPFWDIHQSNAKLRKYILEHGEAFVFARTDWQSCINTFSWGYRIGYHFIDNGNGPCNGSFVGIGADATNIAIQVDQAFPYGLLITNGEFVSFRGDNPTEVVIGPENYGTVQFNNCAFWGPSDRVALIRGSGSVSFDQCNFYNWDGRQDKKVLSESELQKILREHNNSHAIECYGGELTITSCRFGRDDTPDILLGSDVSSAVIFGNTFAGDIDIDNNSKGDVQIGLNAKNNNVMDYNNK